MKKEQFAELMESAEEALEHAQGKRDLRTTVLPSAPKPMKARDVRRLRTQVNASQAVFASCLNVSTKLVQAWESDRRSPEGPALRLLRLAEEMPEVIFNSSKAQRQTSVAMKRTVRKAAARKTRRSSSA